jgi:phosphate transport system substrate-binding protein
MVVLAIIVTACGTAEEPEAGKEEGTGTEETTDTGEETAEELDGSVVIDGSGTVYPLMAVLAEEYMFTEQETVSVEVSRSGTSAGFKKFLIESGTDFNNASNGSERI